MGSQKHFNANAIRVRFNGQSLRPTVRSPKNEN
jgi:hypothetical protein